MKRLGVGVINYNRRDLLLALLNKIKDTVAFDFDLVVADDGSVDGSIDVCRELGVDLVGGVNRGIAWNKNRALYYLSEVCDVENLILIENDCLIRDQNWMMNWCAAIEKWGHVNCLPPSLIKVLDRGGVCPEIISGQGSADDPYLCTKISGICIGASQEAFSQVGYFDTRFKGYGHEHTEWTLRFRRLGYGYQRVQTSNGLVNCNIMISGGVYGSDAPCSSDKSMIDANRLVMEECKKDQVYRFPWRTPEEECVLKKEIFR